MSHTDLVVCMAGVLLTVGCFVAGAWLDLRPLGRDETSERLRSRGD